LLPQLLLVVINPGVVNGQDTHSSSKDYNGKQGQFASKSAQYSKIGLQEIVPVHKTVEQSDQARDCKTKNNIRIAILGDSF